MNKEFIPYEEALALKEWRCLKDAWKELYINIYSYSYMKQMLNGKYNNKTTLIFKT